MEVTKEAYNSCNTTNPLANYTDGETKVKLDRSGPFYFISGANGHCEKGQKLSLVVISPRHSVISPAPSPVEFEDGPALAPAPISGSVRLGGCYVVLGLVLGLCAWFWFGTMWWVCFLEWAFCFKKLSFLWLHVVLLLAKRSLSFGSLLLFCYKFNLLLFLRTATNWLKNKNLQKSIN